MFKVKCFNWLAYIFIFYVGLNVFLVIYFQPIQFDDSYNLEVAKSLSKYFIYQSTYYPRYIYDFRITTNGLIQYIAAFNIKMFGDRTGLALTLALISVFTLGALLKYSWKTFFAALALLLSYFYFSYLLTLFLGEMSALGFIFLGAYFTNRQISKPEDSSLVRHSLLMSSVCYGLAISTKLISGIVLPFIVFGLFYNSRSIDKRLLIHAIKNTAIVYVISLVFFVFMFYFTVLHSQVFLNLEPNTNPDIPTLSLGIIKFVRHHFFQQSGASEYMLKTQDFSNDWIFPLLILSLLIMIISSYGWIPFAVITILLIGFSGMNERRLFLFITPVLLIASCYILTDIKGYFATRKGFLQYFNVTMNIMIACVWVYALINGFQRVTPLFSQTYSLYLNHSWPKFNFAQNSSFGSDYNDFIVGDTDKKVIEAINNEKSPVIVNGWWQYPQLQLRSNISFYDRSVSSVAKQLQGTSPLLLFDPSINSWPETSIKMCSRVIIELPNVILCYYDTSLPLNHRWGIQ